MIPAVSTSHTGRSVRSRSRSIALAHRVITIFTLFVAQKAGAANYGSSVLYPLSSTITQLGNSDPRQTVGYDGNNGHAILCTAAGTVDLNPTNLPGLDSSYANSVGGGQQVGWGYLSSNFYGNQQALLWTGTAASVVDLNPTKLPGITESNAGGTDGTQQVGNGWTSGSGNHALLWTGTAASAVDLTPTKLGGIAQAVAIANDTTQQVGFIISTATGALSHATLWSGTAASAVDLNPTNMAGIVQSEADGVGGNQQVGWGSNQTRSADSALLWTGSAASAVNLSPSNLSGFQSSDANATNGTEQVGWGWGSGTGNNGHALLWLGTPNSAVDLEPFLPSTGSWTGSYADYIDPAGNVFGTAYGTFNNVTGNFAVEWSPIPEPASAALIGFASSALLLRRRQK